MTILVWEKANDKYARYVFSITNGTTSWLELFIKRDGVESSTFIDEKTARAIIKQEELKESTIH